MPRHVGQTKHKLPDAVISAAKLTAPHHFLHSLVGKRLHPSLIMSRESIKKLPAAHEVFIELRRKLNKVTRHIRARQSGIAAAAEQ